VLDIGELHESRYTGRPGNTGLADHAGACTADDRIRTLPARAGCASLSRAGDERLGHITLDRGFVFHVDHLGAKVVIIVLDLQRGGAQIPSVGGSGGSRSRIR
jgi:hypothetical protein